MVYFESTVMPYRFNNLLGTESNGHKLGFIISSGSSALDSMLKISWSTSAAFVGIGTKSTTPLTKELTVEGSISASGDIDVDGSTKFGTHAGTVDSHVFSGSVNIHQTGSVTAGLYITGSPLLVEGKISSSQNIEIHNEAGSYAFQSRKSALGTTGLAFYTAGWAGADLDAYIALDASENFNIVTDNDQKVKQSQIVCHLQTSWYTLIIV